MNIGRPDAEHLNDQDVINTFVWMISELSKAGWNYYNNKRLWSKRRRF